MFFFFRAIVYEVYYGILLLPLLCAHKYYWKKVLHFKDKRKIRRLAYYFLKSQKYERKMEMNKINKYRRINGD